MAEDSDWSYERRKNSFGRQTKGNIMSWTQVSVNSEERGVCVYLLEKVDWTLYLLSLLFSSIEQR